MSPSFFIESESNHSDNWVVQHLSQQIVAYQQLQQKEKKLRIRVDYLEKQAALRGPLAVEVSLATMLQEERSELEVLRKTLETQEKQLKSLQSLPADQRKTIEVQKLERSISDLRANKEQIRILQDNINFLQEKQASFGLDIPLNLVNELKLAKENLEEVQAKLLALREVLKEEWQFDPSEIENLDKVEEDEIRELAVQVIKQHDIRQEQSRVVAADKYDSLVSSTLEELRKSMYSGSDSSVLRKTPNRWGISIIGGFGYITSVHLKFDYANNPASFDCTWYHHDGRELRSKNSGLSRDDLIATLRALYWKEKKWWQFWYKSPPLPKGWSQ